MLKILGVVVNNPGRSTLTYQEKDVWDALVTDCQSAWNAPLKIFDTFIPPFPALAKQNRFPVHHADVRSAFDKLWKEIQGEMNTLQPAVR